MKIRLCLFLYLHLLHTSHFIGITKTNGAAVTKQGRDSKTVSKNITNTNNTNSTNNKTTARKVSVVSGEVKQTKKLTTVASKRPEEKINNNNNSNSNNNNSTNSNKNKKVRKSSKGKKRKVARSRCLF